MKLRLHCGEPYLAPPSASNKAYCSTTCCNQAYARKTARACPDCGRPMSLVAARCARCAKREIGTRRAQGLGPIHCCARPLYPDLFNRETAASYTPVGSSSLIWKRIRAEAAAAAMQVA
ncbi:MAG TPA: hypothetical protein VGM37_01245 [Armatimonadota bacterium]